MSVMRSQIVLVQFFKGVGVGLCVHVKAFEKWWQTPVRLQGLTKSEHSYQQKQLQAVGTASTFPQLVWWLVLCSTITMCTYTSVYNCNAVSLISKSFIALLPCKHLFSIGGSACESSQLFRSSGVTSALCVRGRWWNPTGMSNMHVSYFTSSHFGFEGKRA